MRALFCEICRKKTHIYRQKSKAEYSPLSYVYVGSKSRRFEMTPQITSKGSRNACVSTFLENLPLRRLSGNFCGPSFEKSFYIIAIAGSVSKQLSCPFRVVLDWSFYVFYIGFFLTRFVGDIQERTKFS